jgi:SAM-dependent methyltransferase
MSREYPVCRACGQTGLEVVLDLGRTPLANALLTEAQLGAPEPRYPLELALCPHCALVQILETVPPEVLFRNYVYFSSYSDTMIAHASEIAERLVRERGLGPESLVVEPASNDGYLLQHFRDRGVPVLGIEPARNIAAVAVGRGIPTVSEFFDARLARSLRAEGKAADVILANNVLAHVADLNGFVQGVAALLKADGVAVIETPYIKDLIDGCEFDTIYHEHLCYYSLTALARLFERHGLGVVDVERIPIHGGSLRVTAARAEVSEPSRSVDALLAEEESWGARRPDPYSAFASRVGALRTELRHMVETLKADGRSLAAYGASAKGTTLLHYVGLDARHLDFVVDRSTVKQGLYTPGTHLAIHSPEKLLEAMPDYVLLLTWNFADEILGQQAEYLRGGGRFIIPVPHPRISPPPAPEGGPTAGSEPRA